MDHENLITALKNHTKNLGQRGGKKITFGSFLFVCLPVYIAENNKRARVSAMVNLGEV